MKNFITYSRYWKLVLFLVPALFFTESCGPGSDQPYSNFRGEIFGTTYSINVVTEANGIGELQQKVDSLLDLINLTFSTYQDSSLISFFNNLSDNAILPVLYGSKERLKYGSNLFAECLELSKEVHRNTEGAFDPTAGSLFSIWGFAEGKITHSPDSSEVDSVLSTRGLDHISVDGKEDGSLFVARTDPDSSFRIKLNYNAIAKGMAVDEVARLLEANNISNYLVEIGGEMRLKGKKRNGESWAIGINNPRSEAGLNDAQLYLHPENTGLATSGNYRNYYEEDGKLYAHIIDPVTGYPAKTDILSATVFHPQSGVADGYATAFMVLGSKKSIEIAEKIGLNYVLILAGESDADGYKVIASEGAQSWIFKP